MKPYAVVSLWGTDIGTAYLPENGAAVSFEYEKEFLSSGMEVSPITMPLSSRVYSFPLLSDETFHGLPGLLADSLPDRFGNAMINSWLSSQGRTPESFTAIERLCYTGKRGLGALEFRPAAGPDYTEKENVEVSRLVKLASDVLNEREKLDISNDDVSMKQILQLGTSAGGARAKAIIAWNEETGNIRSGQIDAGDGYEYWLMKFDGVSGNGDRDIKDPPAYTRIEYAYYLMAMDAGIKMSECRLFEDEGLYHFMTKRFDRKEETGDKIHMQTLGAMAHFDYNRPGEHGYEEAAGVMRRIGLKNSSMQEFYRRMVFNVIAANNDDHVKNISFLMDRKGKWSLSPAYDLTFSYKKGNYWLGMHQMSVNGKRENISNEDLLSAAKNMDISRDRALKIMNEVSDSVSRWKSFAEEANVPQKKMETIESVLKELKALRG